MGENTAKNTDNLRPAWKKGESGNPNGRPKGQKNYATLYKEALIKIAESKGTTPEDIELDLARSGVLNAIKGNYQFYRDIMDRIHGKPEENHHLTGDLNINIVKYGETDNNNSTS